jgi:type IV pilus assembly protein PilC
MSSLQDLASLDVDLDEEAERAKTPEPSRLKKLMQLEITRNKVPRKELMHFSRQLAVFIKAGIPILDALEAIHEEMAHKFFRAVVEDIIGALKEGATFADAAALHAEAFPPYFLGILRSAELTGKLDVVLVQLSGYIERDLEARRKVTSALMYPAVIAAMSVVVVVVLVGVVLPKFEVFFANLHTKLPLPTRILLAIGHFATTKWAFIVGGILAVVIALIVVLRSDWGKAARDRLLLKLPIAGDLARHIVLERFCRILSSMMQAGVALPEAMAVTTAAASNAVYRKGLVAVREAMLRGEGLAGPLNQSGLFPPSARQMFKVGESTGTLDTQLETAAGYFERELDYKIKRFTSLFEPIVIIAMGVVVGFVAIALVSAMYGIFRTTKV